MRRFVDSVQQVFNAIWAHKLRSFLTMFGIAWGVGSLLLLVGLGEGFRAGTKKNLASFGEDYMFFTFTDASTGVFAASCGLIGPAFPETSALPPPGSPAVSS